MRDLAQHQVQLVHRSLYTTSECITVTCIQIWQSVVKQCKSFFSQKSWNLDVSMYSPIEF